MLLRHLTVFTVFAVGIVRVATENATSPPNIIQVTGTKMEDEGGGEGDFNETEEVSTPEILTTSLDTEIARAASENATSPPNIIQVTGTKMVDEGGGEGDFNETEEVSTPEILTTSLKTVTGENVTGCLLPDYPENGVYDQLSYMACGSTFKDPYITSRAVNSGCTLLLNCEKGYQPTQQSRQGIVTCYQDQWSVQPNDMGCEAKTTLANTSESTAEGCLLPKYAENRIFLPWVPDSSGRLIPYTPGARVEGSVRVECEEGYKLKNRKDRYFTIVCFDNSWISGELPECEEIFHIFRRVDEKQPCGLPSDKNNRVYLPLVSHNSDTFLWSYHPGSFINEETIIKVQCEPEYGLSDYRDFVELYCKASLWIPQSLPECLKLCPPLESKSVIVTCSYIDSRTGLSREVDCRKGVLPTTTARYACKPGYSEYSCLADEGIYHRTLTCRHDGRWSNILPECSQDIKLRLNTPLPARRRIAIGGCFLPEDPKNRNFFPWSNDRTNSPQMYSPGSKVQGAVEIMCDGGYVLPENKIKTTVICQDNNWIPEEIPECKISDVYSRILPTEPPSEPISGECFLPEKPRNRRFLPWSVNRTIEPTLIYNPGAKVHGAVELRCEDGYVLPDNQTQTTIFCFNDNWIPDDVPECHKLSSHPVQRLQTRDSQSEGCFLPEELMNRKFFPSTPDKLSKPQWIYGAGAKVVGAIDLRCEDGYALQGNKNQTTIFCFQHSWIPGKIPECLETSSQQETNNRSSRVVRSSEPRTPGCFLPKEASNRKFISIQSEDKRQLLYLPGTKVSGQFRVECESGYGMPGTRDYVIIVCYNNRWVRREIPECKKTCPPLYSNSMYITCTYGSKRVDCRKPLLPTTTATYLCKPGYSEYSCLAEEGVYSSTLTCESSGKWSDWLPECKPECGVSRGEGKVIPTLINGTAAELGQFPWHAGLYLQEGDEENKFKYICGGTLISSNVVLTAAHCVKLFNRKLLRVAVGKYYRSWDHEEKNAIKLKVLEVRVPSEYQSVATDYAFDMALLLLNDSLAFSSFVLPVCFDVHREFDIRQDSTGYVVGWGKPEAEIDPPEDLLSAELVINDNQSCKRRLPRTLIFDKFCASKNTGKVVQRGDSGGGITTVLNGLHYVCGIVSIRYIETSIFTNLTWVAHKNWLDNEIDELNII